MAATKRPTSDVGAVIDLDARKAARLEHTGPRIVRFGGTQWQFKPELPMRCVEHFTDGDLVGAFRLILTDPDDAEGFLEAEFTREDLNDLMAGVYGLDLGKQ